MRHFILIAVVASVLGLAGIAPAAVPAAAATGPSVSSNQLVDLDHGLAFPRNKQNEPSITRDPVTGVLIAGANDEVSQRVTVGALQPHHQVTRIANTRQLPYEVHPGTSVSE